MAIGAGIALGVGMGLATNNIALGLSMGILFAVALGKAAASKRNADKTD
ncbi:MAG: hypothetical protein ACOH2N_13890 [Devosia sp.]